MRLVVAIVIVGLVAGFTPKTTRPSARFARLSMAFGLPSAFDSVFQQFGISSDDTAAVQATSAVVATPAVVAAPVAAPVVKQVIAVDPSPPMELSVPEVAAGLGLGLAPYLLIPVLLLNAAKGLIKPAKPLPVPVEPTTTVGAYTKSLQEGLNEGIKELFSENTADTELTKKGIKLSAAGFATSIAFAGILFYTNSVTEASKVITKKPVAPAVIAKVVAPAPVTAAPVPAAVPAVVAPAVVVAPVVAPVVAAPVVAVAAVEIGRASCRERV